MSGTLSDRWRPSRLTELRGQGEAIFSLRSFLAAPTSAAFLFHGSTGTGKTSAALAFAAELGVDVANAEFGGLYQIPSGEQTADTVRGLADQLRFYPMTGNGWRVAIVNEADCITAQAANVWLDVLENLPPKAVVIFTTNNVEKLPPRFRDRCERVEFKGTTRALKAFAEQYVQEVWTAEGGSGAPPTLLQLGAVEEGEISFRRILQNLAPMIRVNKAEGKERVSA